ncbi:hypothetical protein A2291_03455 [candidate division WOR-1 bacterium RIFOXYB2_FULL_42_35]|uniref:Protein kinase domain-containing protein n=1 Tax=candidate division WOR-1 bacterium RIFOXYC2_FULL_41_25 TaxID=1802586 RepID=A0A1F4TQE7_UNCSA|nr:MAG: hypothetical protein A2247_03025 [candidate division WOR-1 bacterium RIFOXYA2_FULL_41_14]OGC25520.1 MAG: hypothetical protein A2291_03455 [candidate division WOR-1 bacterium RIFOXYB2_FULL_42_35]OGC34952.1 MAG: hypothetical protein A2462_05085 [candidate division WOR-1 bacterium RIFOXYC2_FULL_41_25]
MNAQPLRRAASASRPPCYAKRNVEAETRLSRPVKSARPLPTDPVDPQGETFYVSKSQLASLSLVPAQEALPRSVDLVGQDDTILNTPLPFIPEEVPNLSGESPTKIFPPEPELTDNKLPLLVPGTTIKRFSILRELGRGGMGIVYLVEDLSSGAKAALKFMAAHCRHVYRAERNTTFLLRRDPNSPEKSRLLAYGDATEVHLFLDPRIGYYVIPFIEGQNLAEKIDVCPLSLSEALHYLKSTIQDLLRNNEDNVETQGDLKPENLIIDRFDQIHIIDNGLAQISREEIKEGSIMGTPSYMAPEQFRGAKPSEKTDLYALGLIFSEMLTGEDGFGGKSFGKIMWEKHLLTRLPVPHTVETTETIKPVLDRLLAKLTANNPNDRYDSLEEAMEDVELLEYLLKNPNISINDNRPLKVSLEEIPRAKQALEHTPKVTTLGRTKVVIGNFRPEVAKAPNVITPEEAVSFGTDTILVPADKLSGLLAKANDPEEKTNLVSPLPFVGKQKVV